MDPTLILGAVAATLRIVKEVCQTIQWMQRVYDSLKNSNRTLKMILLECNIYGDSIKSIGEWLKDNQATKGLQKQMRTTNNAIKLVRVSMMTIQKDLEKIGGGDQKLSIKSFKSCIEIRHQWFEQTMEIHLTELRCHSQTLQMTLQVIQLTKTSELTPTMAQKAPAKLEQKTKSLEKRLLLRHFISKALEIRRAEIAAEEKRQSEAMEQFIRFPAVSPQNQAQKQDEEQHQSQTQSPPLKQLQVPSLHSVTQQARRQAFAEKVNEPKDLLSDDIESGDLIDFSNQSQAPPNQATPNSAHSHKDLSNLAGLSSLMMMPQQTALEIATKVEGSTINQGSLSGKTCKPMCPESPELASQLLDPNTNKPDIDAQCPETDDMSELTRTKSPQPPSQLPNSNVKMAEVDTQSMASDQGSDMSLMSTATPSIFSHASTLSSASSASMACITEAELHERNCKMQSLANSSPYIVPPSQPVRRKAIRSMPLGNSNQGGLSGSSITSVLAASPTIYEDVELNPSATDATSTKDTMTGSTIPELLTRSKSEDVVHQLHSIAQSSVPSIDKPDTEGFPWIVQVARDGDEIKLQRLIVSGADLEAVHTTTKRNALCEASLQGNSKIVDILIQKKCQLDYADAEDYTALHYACDKGHLAIAKSLLAAGADIEAAGPGGQTPIHLAAQVPHKNVVMLLLQRKANVNARDNSTRSPLHISAAQGNTEMCKFLLENGAQLDNRDSRSRTALQVACEAGHYESLETMLYWSSLRATDFTFLAAFFAAVEFGHVRIAESFFRRGLNLKKLKVDAYKPATLAAKNGSLAMLELMIRENCTIKAKDNNDWNALHFAAQRGHWQIVERLLANDVSVKAATRTKETPLILAVKGGHFAATEILLRSKGIAVTVEDAQDQQPIHHATRAGSLEIFNLLLSNGAKIAVENAFGWHPIHIAVAYGHTALVDRLIEQSAKIEEKLGSSSVKKDQTHKMVEDGYWAEARWPYPGSRPLHLACEYGHYQIASILISKGAAIEATCSEGWRPIHHAAFNGSSTLVELLLNAGCHPWAETDEGNTPLALQFRKAGSPIPETEKDKVRELLKFAMDTTMKQKTFKVARKKGRTLEEKHNLIRAATFSMEMVSAKHSTEPRRPQLAHPSAPHSNSFPSAVPGLAHHVTQAVAAAASPLPERPTSSHSNRPSTGLSEPNPNTAPITSALAPSSATTASSPHQSISHLQQLTPGLRSGLKLKRASTFGLGMSKQGIEKMSSGLDISKQGIERMSSLGLDVSKQGLEKMSRVGLDASKQGLEKMSSYGMDMSKQGLDMVRQQFKIRRKKLELDNAASIVIGNSGDNGNDNTNIPQNSGKPQGNTQDGEEPQGVNIELNLNNNECGDDDLQDNVVSDAASISAFTMGGFDSYDVGGDDGGDGDGY